MVHQTKRVFYCKIWTGSVHRAGGDQLIVVHNHADQLSSGHIVGFVGVTPDIEVAEGSDDFKFNSETDNQLNFAIKLLNG